MYCTVRRDRMSEIGFTPDESVAWSLNDSEKFNEIRAHLRRAGCVLRINRRRTLNGQWADHNRTMGEPWMRPMLAFAALSVNKHRTHGESRVCYGQRNDRPNEKPTVNDWWTRRGPAAGKLRAGHECGKGERAWNEQHTCGESIASMQSTADWQRSRFEKCESSPDDGPQQTTSLNKDEHNLRHWNELWLENQLLSRG